MRTSNINLGPYMTRKQKKIMSYKSLYLIDVYKFGFGHFSIWVPSNKSKKLNSKIQEFQAEF
jgi:hypothetical protein